MNILYLHTHDSGRYFSPYGYPVDTPHIARLADEGVLFRRAFCANPTCSPSRAAMLTGQYAHSCGMLGLAHRGFSFENPDQHLCRFLQTVGYETVLCGVQHEGKPKDLGYSRVLPVTGVGFDDRDASTVAEAVKYLGSRQEETPFFLSVGFINTHRPYPQGDKDSLLAMPIGTPDTPDTRRDMAGLDRAIRTVDEGVGAVLDALAAAHLDGDTLVMFTTDHGIAFPRHKCTLYDGGIGVALMMRLPGVLPRGKTVDALVSQVDIFPTLCEMIGIAPPPWTQGVSLLPLLRGETDRVRDAVFAEVNFHVAYEPARCVRTERYKYIRYFDTSRDRPVICNVDAGPARAAALADGLAEQTIAREQLYDLEADPAERNDLAADPAMAAVLSEMRARLRAWREETSDPLLTADPLPAPAGAVVNPPSDFDV